MTSPQQTPHALKIEGFGDGGTHIERGSFGIWIITSDCERHTIPLLGQIEEVRSRPSDCHAGASSVDRDGGVFVEDHLEVASELANEIGHLALVADIGVTRLERREIFLCHTAAAHVEGMIVVSDWGVTIMIL